MRILWIELTNYIGIYNGLGLTNISIDFTKCVTDKILIKGLNGSGKSTLYNALSINPDGNENFVPGVEARKNICVVCDGIKYTIRYIHGVDSNGNRMTSKGYISKTTSDGEVELNPNGNISSVKEIIYDEFNLDSNFMALSQLSTDDRGLAYKIPSARKKFVTNIINVLEVYNNINKLISKKASIFKTTINSLTYKIDAIGDEMTLQLNLNSIEARLNTLNAEKDSILEIITALKIESEKYKDNLQQNNYDSVVAEIKVLSKNINNMNKDITLSLNSYNAISSINELPDYIKELKEIVIRCESRITQLKTEIPSLLAEREMESSRLQDKTEHLNSLQSEYNYLDMKNAVDKANSIIEEYDKVFKSIGMDNMETITKDEFDAGIESVSYLRALSSNLTSKYTYDSILSVLENRDKIISMRKDINTITKERDDIKDKYHELEKELIVWSSNREKVDKALPNRPSKCKIDSCYFIQSIIEADKAYPKDEFLRKNEELEQLKSNLDSTSSLIDNFFENNNILIAIESIERELQTRARFIKKLPLRNDFIDTFITRAMNLDPFKDILKLREYADCGNLLEEYKVAKENLRKYESEFKVFESRNVLIESIIDDIKSITEKTDVLADKIDEANTEIKSLETKILSCETSINKASELYNKYTDNLVPANDRLHELQSIKDSLEDSVEVLNKIQSDINTQYNLLGVKETEIKNTIDNRDKIKHQSSLLKEYKQELEVYNNKYIKIEKIKYYSSPSTGIQTLFMELYMNKTIAIANDLLSLLFNGEFVLQPFIINENEFRIPCVGNGLMHDDISSMSTAQKSMISMILSFSLLYQSSTKYNIIKLDEIDGGLDSVNRPYFITLLDNLMSMLKCEQAFIISHNSELDDTSCDVILLKDDIHNSLVSDKANIIWRAS